MLVRMSGMLRVPADMCCGVVGQCFVGRVVGCANLPQNYLLAPPNNVNGVDGVLLGLKAVRAQCWVDVFRSDVPVMVL